MTVTEGSVWAGASVTKTLNQLLFQKEQYGFCFGKKYKSVDISKGRALITRVMNNG